jgi:hypothetical protein
MLLFVASNFAAIGTLELLGLINERLFLLSRHSVIRSLGSFVLGRIISHRRLLP